MYLRECLTINQVNLNRLSLSKTKEKLLHEKNRIVWFIKDRFVLREVLVCIYADGSSVVDHLMVHRDVHGYRLIVYLVNLRNIWHLVALFLLVHQVNRWVTHKLMGWKVSLKQHLRGYCHILIIRLLKTIWILLPFSLPFYFQPNCPYKLHLLLSFRRQLIGKERIWRWTFSVDSHLWLLKFNFCFIFFLWHICIILFILQSFFGYTFSGISFRHVFCLDNWSLNSSLGTTFLNQNLILLSA